MKLPLMIQLSAPGTDSGCFGVPDAFGDKVRTMKELKNRRNFLKLAGMVGTGSFLACKQSHAGGEPMRLGVVAWVRKGETPDAVVAKVQWSSRSRPR